MTGLNPQDVAQHPTLTLWLSIVTMLLLPLIGFFIKRSLKALDTKIGSLVTQDSCKVFQAQCQKNQIEFLRRNFPSVDRFDKETGYLCAETKGISEHISQMQAQYVQQHGAIYDEIKRNREKVIDEINCIKREIGAANQLLRSDISKQMADTSKLMIEHLSSHTLMNNRTGA